MARFFCLRSIIKSKLDKSNERNDRLFDIVLLVSKKVVPLWEIYRMS